MFQNQINSLIQIQKDRWMQVENFIKRDCIPVGCVPPASVAIGGEGVPGLCVHPPVDSPLQAHPRPLWIDKYE